MHKYFHQYEYVCVSSDPSRARVNPCPTPQIRLLGVRLGSVATDAAAQLASLGHWSRGRDVSGRGIGCVHTGASGVHTGSSGVHGHIPVNSSRVASSVSSVSVDGASEVRPRELQVS